MDSFFKFRIRVDRPTHQSELFYEFGVTKNHQGNMSVKCIPP